MAALPSGDGGDSAARGVRRQQQRAASTTRTKLYGDGDGDIGGDPALDHDLGHGAVSKRGAQAPSAVPT